MTDGQLKFRVNTSSAIPIVVIGAIAIAAGLFHQSAGGIAFGAMLTSVPLVVLGALRRSVRKLTIRRNAPQTVYEGDEVEILIQIENGSNLPLFFPEVSEIFAPEIHAQKDVLFPDRLAPKEVAERSYIGDCLLPRGLYSIGPTAVAVSDPFGWFQVRKELKGTRQIKVYPRVHDIRLREQLGDCVSHVVDEMTRPSLGESNEFLSVREYRVGDPLRRVHWGLTARRGFPVVREFARTSTGDMTIFLDTYKLALTGVGRSSSIEHSVKIAGSFAAKAIGRGHRVQLIAGEEEEQRTPLSSGSVQFQRVLDVLVGVKPTGKKPLSEVLEANAREVAPGTTVVVTVSRYLLNDRRFESVLRVWRARGVRVVTVIFDVGSFLSVWGRPEEELKPSDSDECHRRFQALGFDSFILSSGADLRAVFAGLGTVRSRESRGEAASR